MQNALDADDSLKADIKTAIADEQLQFWTRHPAPDHGWKATRACSPEIVAFKNREVMPIFWRLGVERYYEGETDEDGYTWDRDAYVINIQDGAVPEERGYIVESVFEDFHDRAVIYDRETLIDTLAHIMAMVVQNRDDGQ